MRAALRAMHRVVRHPLTTTIAGIVFLLAGIAEIFEASLGFVGEAGLESSHAIVVLGVITVLKGVGEMFEAEAILEEAASERATAGRAASDKSAPHLPPRP